MFVDQKTLIGYYDKQCRPKCNTASFQQVLHCLLKQNLSSEKVIQHVFETITHDPSIYTMDHPDLIVSSFIAKMG